MDSNRVLVRDFEGKVFEMKAIERSGGLVYVAYTEDDGLCAVGVPAEDVFEFTKKRDGDMKQWKG